MAAAPVPLETAPLSIAEKIEKARKIKLADGSSPSDTDIITHLIGPDKYAALKKADVSEADILTHLTGSPSGKPLESPAPISDEEVKTKKLGPNSIFNRNRTVEKIKSTTPDDVVNFLRPILDNAAGAGAATLSLPAAPATLGVAPVAAYGLGFTGTDLLLQKLLSKPEQGLASRAAGFEPGGVASDLTNTAELGAGGKVLDTVIPKAARAVSNFAKEWTAPGTVMGGVGAQFKKTYSQYADRPGFPKWVEDIFAPISKAARQEESGQIGKDLMTGGKEFKPQAAYDKAEASLVSAGNQMSSASRFNGEIAAAHAETNPTAVVRPVQIGMSTPIHGPNSTPQNPQIVAPAQPIMAHIPETVNGPVPVNKAVARAQQYLDEQKQSVLAGVVPTENEKDLSNIAHKIIDKANTIDPATGQKNIMSFRDAWDLKQKAAELGYAKPFSAAAPTLTSSDHAYLKDIADGFNDDISAALPTWKNGAAEAKAAWENSKAIAGQRQLLLNVSGTKLRDIIEDAGRKTNLPALDALIADKRQLQNAITAGEYQFPGGGRVYTSTKPDLKGYQLQKMIEDSWIKDPIVEGSGRLDGQKWKNAWENANFKESRDILWNASERSDIEQTMKNFAQTQTKPMLTGKHLPIWLSSKAIMFAPSLALGYMTGHSALEKGGIMAVGLSGAALAKAFNNPRFAAALRAASSGQPLGVSQDFMARTISKIAQGGTLNLLMSDGKEQKAKVDSEGQMSPAEEQ